MFSERSWVLSSILRGKAKEVVQPEPTAFIASPTTSNNAKQSVISRDQDECVPTFSYIWKKSKLTGGRSPIKLVDRFHFFVTRHRCQAPQLPYYYFRLVEDRLALTYYYSPRRLGFSHQTRANAEIQCQKETSESNNWVYDQKLDTTKLLPHTPSVS